MDVARIAVLALSLLFGSVGTAWASDPPTAIAIPVHSASAQAGQKSTAYSTFFAQPRTAQTALTAPAPDITYGAPYRYGPWFASGSGCTQPPRFPSFSGPPESTVGAAVTDYENQFISCFGVGCAWTVLGADPGNPSPNIFGFIEDGGNCSGEDDIYGTAHSANVGDGSVNGDGEGEAIHTAAPDVGDPVNASTGNKYLVQNDYVDTPWLTLRRFYNSNIVTPTSLMGPQWRHSFDRSLVVMGGTTPTIIMTRPDGSQTTFTKVSSAWSNTVSQVDQLTETDNAQGVPTLYTAFIGANRHTETYSTAGLLLSVADQAGQGIALTYSTSSTPTTVAPSAGLLLTVTDSKGRQLNFSYSVLGLVAKVTLPDQGTITYSYNGNEYLTGVTYPDGSSKQYLNNESGLVQASSFSTPYLTGIRDETGSRYSTTAYDADNRAVETLFGSGANDTRVAYNSDGTSTITYPLGYSATMGFSQTNGMNQIASVDQSCAPDCQQQWKARTYDANGYPATQTDFNGNLTTIQYDAYGELNVEVDASGTTSQRTINTTWNTTLRLPLTRTVLDENGSAVTKTSWIYNSMGQALAKCEIDPAKASSYVCATTGTAPTGVRRSLYTYCNAVSSSCPLVGLMLTATGPRTDLTQTTTFAYYTTSSATSCGSPGAACYQAGDLHTSTDALGHITTIASYDADGRITRVTDANGVNTDSTYTPRGWLATHIVGGATTAMTYWPFGAVETVTDPDGVVTTYTYDAAHRLIEIIDSMNNRVEYTLDGSGNKTAEQTNTINPITVVRSLSRIYNTLGQLTTVVDGLNHTVFSASATNSYDANGNLVLSSDALGIQRQQGLDPLNRLISTIYNYNGVDPATKNTETVFDRDALNRLDGVTDPSGLNTLTTYDGLNNRTELQSPDTGTSTDTYDAAGNRLTHTDAKGTVSTSTFDALNRPSTTSYVDTTLNVTYTYDEANTVTGCSVSSPVGRLTRVVEGSVTTVFCYDSRANVLQKQQVTTTHTDTTKYTYTVANRPSSITAPDLTVVNYVYNADGRASSVTVTPSGSTSAPPTVVSAITWLPFGGPITSYTLGNGQTVTRTYDANYRLTDLTSPALVLHFARNAMGDIVALGNAPGANPATETYSYDPLHRLTGITDAGTVLESYTYNQTGDRLSKTAPGLATGAYLYTTGTHKLASVGSAIRANDANGNTTGSVIGGNTYGFGYNDRNRLALTQLNGVTAGTYTYNALGERIGKVATSPQAMTERYAYNEVGQLIGEYGTTNRDYIWVGTLPVAVVDNTINGSTITSIVNYVTADQLGTPRAISNSVGTMIWSWAYAGNPFGEQQPTSTTGYVLNLRYPGQYYDAESGTNYNVNRNFEPAVGRYQQSDPIGLDGGISTYAYVSSNPLSHRDPLGMDGLGDMQGAFCPGNLCTLPQDMIQNSWGAPNMAPVYIMDGAAIAASGGLALPLVSDAALPVIANTLLAANVLTGAIELPEAIVTGAAPTEEVLSQELDYIIESFETPPPPPTLPVPTQPVAAPMAVPAGNHTRCQQ
jgi:RHS repeat-associated protein